MPHGLYEVHKVVPSHVLLVVIHIYHESLVDAILIYTYCSSVITVARSPCHVYITKSCYKH
mgnify:CR=1 FL=1